MANQRIIILPRQRHQCCRYALAFGLSPAARQSDRRGAGLGWRDHTRLARNIEVPPQADVQDALARFAQLADQDHACRQTQQHPEQAARRLERGGYELCLRKPAKAAGRLPDESESHGRSAIPTQT